MELIDIMRSRRSVRRYTEEKISDEQLKQIVSAALLAPSGHSKYPCEFLIVKNRELLEGMSSCRKGVAKMLSGAAAAIVVIADRDKSDTIIEDSSVAMMNMELMATSLGIGNCWIQVRGREAEDDSTSENYLRSLLDFPENFACQSILSLGFPAKDPKVRELDKLDFDKVKVLE
ncbi:MAG: nitroreductase family protein [Selenomonadaceae bacterium]|nr:nitroreductase family protein [Selenomonadaceae bacterium]